MQKQIKKNEEQKASENIWRKDTNNEKYKVSQG